MTARQTLLDGLARDADIFELVSELAPLHPRDSTFPGEVFLHLAADALDWCGASRSGPLALEGLREPFLPESDTFAVVVILAAGLHDDGGASQAWPGALPAAAGCWDSRSRDRTRAAWTLAGPSLLPRCGRDGPGREVA